MEDKTKKVTLILYQYVKKRPALAGGIVMAIRGLSVFTAGGYLYFLFLLFFHQDERLFLFAAVPAAVFLFITILRKKIARKRPFELFHFCPLMPHGMGESFPSRHTASAAVIASAVLYLGNPLWPFFLLGAVLIGFGRTALGVHYISDVAAGLFLGFGLGCLGFFCFHN